MTYRRGRWRGDIVNDPLRRVVKRRRVPDEYCGLVSSPHSPTFVVDVGLNYLCSGERVAEQFLFGDTTTAELSRLRCRRQAARDIQRRAPMA